MSHPLSLIRTGQRRMLRQEEIAGPAAGTSRTIFDVSGAGIVDVLWLTFADVVSATFDMRIRVYVDGEAVPRMDVDASTLFMYTRGDRLPARMLTTQHVTGHCGGTASPTAASGTLRLPMPYSDGVRVELLNPSSRSGGRVWAQLVHSPGAASPWRLNSRGRTWTSRVALGAADTYRFLDLPGDGVLVWHYIGGGLASNWTWLERDILITVDGAASPTYVTSGLEDWFLGAHYFLNQPYSRPDAAAHASSGLGHHANAAVDLLAAHGGIPWRSRLVMDLDTEPRVTSGHQMAWVALYYTS
jgi:hypothetical protein